MTHNYLAIKFNCPTCGLTILGRLHEGNALRYECQCQTVTHIDFHIATIGFDNEESWYDEHCFKVV